VVNSRKELIERFLKVLLEMENRKGDILLTFRASMESNCPSYHRPKWLGDFLGTSKQLGKNEQDLPSIVSPQLVFVLEYPRGQFSLDQKGT